MRSVPTVIRALTLVVVALATLTACTTFGDSEGEHDRVTGYAVEAVVNHDGTVDMTETIAYDFGDEPAPGLYRDMPVTIKENFLVHQKVEVNDVEVSSPSGAPDGIRESSESHGWYTLRVGDEDEPVIGGQTYVLSYTLEGAVSEEEEHTELYWDFVGTGWDVPMDEVEVVVHAPGITEIECRRGDGDEVDLPCATYGHNGETAMISQGSLAAGHAVTGLLEMPQDAVVTEEDPVLRPLPRWLTLPGVLGLGGFLLLGWALLYFRTRQVKRRRDAASDQAPVEVPAGLSPAGAGYLLNNQQLDARHLLALVVELEEQGWITSRPHDGKAGEWVFSPNPDASGAPSPAQRILLEAMFPHGSDPVGLDKLAKTMDARKGKHLANALTREGRGLGLYEPLNKMWPRWALALALTVGAFLLPPALNDLTPLELPVLTGIGLVLCGLCAAFLAMPQPRTLRGEQARDLLKDLKTRPQELEPALAVALKADMDLPASARDLTPAFYRDARFRERWSTTLAPVIQPPASSGGGGGASAGGGGGGGGGGRG